MKGCRGGGVFREGGYWSTPGLSWTGALAVSDMCACVRVCVRAWVCAGFDLCCLRRADDDASVRVARDAKAPFTAEKVWQVRAGIAQPSLTHCYCQPIDGWQPTGAAQTEWGPGKNTLKLFFFLLMCEPSYDSLLWLPAQRSQLPAWGCKNERKWLLRIRARGSFLGQGWLKGG